MTDHAAHTTGVDMLVARVKDRSALLADWDEDSADGDDVDQVRGELIEALSEIAAIARERDFQENRYKQEHRTRHAMEDEISRLARRAAELEAALEDALTVFVDTQWHAAKESA